MSDLISTLTGAGIALVSSAGTTRFTTRQLNKAARAEATERLRMRRLGYTREALAAVVDGSEALALFNAGRDREALLLWRDALKRLHVVVHHLEPTELRGQVADFMSAYTKIEMSSELSQATFQALGEVARALDAGELGASRFES